MPMGLDCVLHRNVQDFSSFPEIAMSHGFSVGNQRQSMTLRFVAIGSPPIECRQSLVRQSSTVKAAHQKSAFHLSQAISASYARVQASENSNRGDRGRRLFGFP